MCSHGIKTERINQKFNLCSNLHFLQFLHQWLEGNLWKTELHLRKNRTEQNNLWMLKGEDRELDELCSSLIFYLFGCPWENQSPAPGKPVILSLLQVPGKQKQTHTTFSRRGWGSGPSFHQLPSNTDIAAHLYRVTVPPLFQTWFSRS